MGMAKHKYIIIKLPEDISLVDEFDTMEILKLCKFDFQWYNNGFETDEELFV